MSARTLTALALAVTTLGSLPGPARADAPAWVPSQLQPWIPWVLHDLPDRACARIADELVCGWPGRLTLDVQPTRGDFVQDVHADGRALVALPGGAVFWPQEVQVDGQPAVVGRTPDGDPQVRVEAGAHRVTGHLPWPAPPQVVRVPRTVATIRLTTQGAPVERPRRDQEGRLWIQEGGAADAATPDADDTLRVSVYRRLQDGVPLRVTTLVQLNVSGRAREVALGAVLLPGTRPTTVRGELPVRVRGAEVGVYVRPGTHEVEIDAWLATPADQLTAPAIADASFDPQEVWVWLPDEAIRSVELDGLTGVDPGRTSLPGRWHGSTTFLAEAGQTLTLRTTRRGEPDPPPNQLHLERALWLDLDGAGYTIRDRVSGTMRQGWRLEYAGPGELGHVRKLSHSDDLLITAGPDTGRAGVELRDSSLSLEAEVRLDDARTDLPAVGWAHDMQSLATTLHLPPGWTLLHAGGVDQVGGTWVDSWSLFEFFILLLVALSMGRLFGWPWAVVAGLALVLAHNEPDTPRYVWFHLLAAVALLNVLPAAQGRGWFRRAVTAYLLVGFVSLIVILFPWARHQLRYAFHPQVNQQWSEVYYDQGLTEAFAQPDYAKSAEEYDIVDAIAVSERSMGPEGKGDDGRAYRGKGKKGGKAALVKQLQQIDPNAVVQMGPGLPTWSWRAWQLGWSGPVFEGHRLDLWLLSPGWNRVLAILRVIFFVLMTLVFLAPRRFASRRDPDAFDPLAAARQLAPGATVVAGALLLAAFSAAPDARAEALDLPQAQSNQIQQLLDAPNHLGLPPIPAGDLLGTLRARLVAADRCDGPCVTVSRMTAAATGQRLTLTAEVHVGARRGAGWVLPGPTSVLRLDAVRVDGAPTLQLRREVSGLVAVRLPAGRHEVVVEGTLPAKLSVVTLQLDPGGKPRYVTFASEDWTVDGLDRHGVPQDSLQLSRRSGEAPTEAAEPEAEATLPPWYDVSRSLSLGLPWQVRTTVSRDRDDRPQLVKVPLLPGASVITDGVRVEDGHALVHFPRGTSEVTYASELPVTPTVTLRAPTDVPWSETWTLECSRIWRCEQAAGEGLTPIRTVDSDGAFRPTWKPWPGESVELAVGRPLGTPGEATTVTAVTYQITPGSRLLEANLRVEARASQGTWQRLTLPEEAQLQEVTIDGQAKTLQLEGRVLTVPLHPGEQTVALRWQQPWERGVTETFPVVDIGSPAANVRLELTVGEDRWMLWTWGPDWGPAVLFWAHLAILLLLALLLGRLRNLPVRTHQWFLLAIGLSQLPVITMLVVVGWLLMLVRREAAPFERWWAFDLYQAGLAAATLATLGVLYAAVHTNLLFDIDMQVEGAGSSNWGLSWYVDRIDGATPTAGMLSLPLLVWRGAMLLWALWLVRQLFRWLPWAWRRFSAGGYWRPFPRRPRMPPPPGLAATPPPATRTPTFTPPPPPRKAE